MSGLRAARLDAGLTVAEAAAEVGISPGYLRQCEGASGGALLTLQRALRLAELYAVPVVRLVTVGGGQTSGRQNSVRTMMQVAEG